MNIILLAPEDWLDENTVCLDGHRHAHIRGVLKAGVGDALRVGLLGGLRGYGTVIKLSDEHTHLRVELVDPPLPRHPCGLILALPRPKMLRRVFRTAAEMGVAHLYLINSVRVEKSYWQSPLLQPDRVDAALTACSVFANALLEAVIIVITEIALFAPAGCRSTDLRAWAWTFGATTIGTFFSFAYPSRVTVRVLEAGIAFFASAVIAAGSIARTVKITAACLGTCARETDSTGKTIAIQLTLSRLITSPSFGYTDLIIGTWVFGTRCDTGPTITNAIVIAVIVF